MSKHHTSSVTISSGIPTNAELAAHVGACLKAIASIGGDPATVGELVEALKNLHAMVLGEFPSLLEDNCTGDNVYRVLAKLPENSND